MIMNRILITGSKGFIGRNLVLNLQARGYEIYEFDSDTDDSALDKFCQTCDFVFHFAGINRPEKEEDFMDGNYGFTSRLLNTLKKYNNRCPIMFSSSVQAELDNPYGISKRKSEELIKDYSLQARVPIYIFRFPNVFGKWCRPNYNSVVATFCHNIATGKKLEIHNPDADIRLVYIDDVIDTLSSLIDENHDFQTQIYQSIPVYHDTTVGKLADIISSFGEIRGTRQLPYLLEGSLEKKLYSTYLSYLPDDQFAYSLDMHSDHRGSFTELFRTNDRGQISVNIIKPGIEKGNHWHNTKNEKFCVVSGKALIQLRKVGSNEVISHCVSSDNIEIVDIPCGYTHSIMNNGTQDTVTIIWCNECFNPEKSDTYFCKVNLETTE